MPGVTDQGRGVCVICAEAVGAAEVAFVSSFGWTAHAMCVADLAAIGAAHEGLKAAGILLIETSREGREVAEVLESFACGAEGDARCAPDASRGEAAAAPHTGPASLGS